MGADDEQVGVCAPVEFCKAGVVVPQHFSIECDKGLHRREGTRDTGATVDGAVVEKRIATVEHPSVAGIDGYACVPAGVASQRDQDYARGDLVKLLGCGETSPLLPSRVVFNDFGLMCPLSGSVARLLEPRRGGDGAEGLGRGDVNLGVREVGQTADVVQVEVRDDDVADIVTREPELLDLVGGGFVVAEDGSEKVAQRSDPPGGFGAVVRAEAGVDQHQAAVGFAE